MNVDHQPTSGRRQRLRSLPPLLLGGIWCALLAYGGASLWRHTWTPGMVGTVPSDWPVVSRIPRATDAYTLLLFAHPQCPCVRTSLDELARVVGEYHEHVRPVVVIYHPTGQGPEWSNEFQREVADQAPGTLIVDDVGLVETIRFGVRTSGQTMLFAADGELAFAGGITAGRGHAGESLGASSLRAALAGGVATSQAPVFGCSLGLNVSGN